MVVGGERRHNFLAFNLCRWQDLCCSSARFKLLHLCFMVQLLIKRFSLKTMSSDVDENMLKMLKMCSFYRKLLQTVSINFMQLICYVWLFISKKSLKSLLYYHKKFVYLEIENFFITRNYKLKLICKATSFLSSQKNEFDTLLLREIYFTAHGL